MKLWQLSAIPDLPINDNPWEPWYDKNFGFIIRAATEERARELAHSASSYESTNGFKPWIYAKYSICEEISIEGEEGILIIDNHGA